MTAHFHSDYGHYPYYLDDDGVRAGVLIIPTLKEQ